MVSNTEKGRLFREQCREALQKLLGQNLETEVAFTVNAKPRRFDLASVGRRLVVECKAYTWTASGNVPSAKITHLREAVTDLNAVTNVVDRWLVMKRDPHPKRSETLAEYFVRLNETMLRAVSVYELDEKDGGLRCVRASAGGSSLPRAPLPPKTRPRPPAITALGSELRRILDRLEGEPKGKGQGEDLAPRISRLEREGKLPPNIANLMHTLRKLRNQVEHHDYQPTPEDEAIVENAWVAISDWAQTGTGKDP